MARRVLIRRDASAKRFSYHMCMTVREYALAGFVSNADVASVLARHYHPDIQAQDVANWRRTYHLFDAAVAGAQAEMDAKAITVIGDAIVNGDVNTARWWLERRNPRFKPTAKIDMNARVEGLDARLSRRLGQDDLLRRGILAEIDPDDALS